MIHTLCKISAQTHTHKIRCCVMSLSVVSLHLIYMLWFPVFAPRALSLHLFLSIYRFVLLLLYSSSAHLSVSSSFLPSFSLQSFCLSSLSILLFPFISFTRFTLMPLSSFMILIITYFYTLTFFLWFVFLCPWFIHSVALSLFLSCVLIPLFPNILSITPPSLSFSLSFFLVQWRVLSGSLRGCYSNGSREWGMCC